MEKINLPSKIEIMQDSKNPNRAYVVIEPFYPGYGQTIGNSLRRVLLSSLPGAAVTAVKIKGVSHEFSTLPHIKEEVLEIILNLRRLRLRMFTDEVQRLNLKASGEKAVLASDFEKNPNIEIINPNLVIATLTDKKAGLDMEVWVEKGRGYVPVEGKEREVELSVIAVDSIFTPIQKVGYVVENVRVGKRTDYDKLVLDIETDGTISPKEAVVEASKVLLDHYNFLAKFEGDEETTKEAKKEETKQEGTEEIASAAPVKRKRGRPKKQQS